MRDKSGGGDNEQSFGDSGENTALSEISALNERMLKLDTMIVSEMALRDAATKQQLDELREIVSRVASASAIECILQNGLGEIADRLAPLQQIVPDRSALDDAGLTRLDTVRTALARPDFAREQGSAAITWQRFVSTN